MDGKSIGLGNGEKVGVKFLKNKESWGRQAPWDFKICRILQFLKICLGVTRARVVMLGYD